MIFAPLLLLSLGPAAMARFLLSYSWMSLSSTRSTSTPPLNRGDVEDFAEIQVDPVGSDDGKKDS